MNFDVVCLGDVTIDAFLDIKEESLHARINRETQELCVKYGDKIPVQDSLFLLGGNACNVSVGLSRLGLKSALMAEMGDDEFSQKIIKGLNKENVSEVLALQTAGSTTSFSMILSFRGERTIFNQQVQRLHNFSFDNFETNWMYMTSIGYRWDKAYGEAVGFAKKNKVRIGFNPGTLQIDAGADVIKDVLEISDILFVNKEEAAELIDYELRIRNYRQDEEEMEKLLKNLQSLGPKTVVITDGRSGSYCMPDNGKVYYKKAIHREVVENTGAGDAYSTAFLGAVIHGKSIEEAMEWGSRNAASVIQKIGAQSGLLTKKELEQ